MGTSSEPYTTPETIYGTANYGSLRQYSKSNSTNVKLSGRDGSSD